MCRSRIPVSRAWEKQNGGKKTAHLERIPRSLSIVDSLVLELGLNHVSFLHSFFFSSLALSLALSFTLSFFSTAHSLVHLYHIVFLGMYTHFEKSYCVFQSTIEHSNTRHDTPRFPFPLFFRFSSSSSSLFHFSSFRIIPLCRLHQLIND